MRETLASGRWDRGTTTLSAVNVDAVDPSADHYGRPATGFERRSFGYEFDSDYDPEYDDRDPTPVLLYPEELRALIYRARNEIGVLSFRSGTFRYLERAYDGSARHHIAEIGDSSNGWSKRFTLKTEDGNLYLKIQRGGGNSWLRASPTMGRQEFEGIFNECLVL